MTVSEEVARLARDRNAAQSAARHAAEALASLGMAEAALRSLGGDGTTEAVRAALDAAEPLERLVLRTRDTEKAAQGRFRAAWEEYRGAATAAGGGNGNA